MKSNTDEGEAMVNDFREKKAYQEAFNEGKEIGIGLTFILGYLEGRKLESEAIALRMARMKIPLEIIAEVMGLSPSAIKTMKKKRV